MKEYWYAKRAITRLLLELDVAKTAYERNIDSTVVSGGSVKTDRTKKITSPTERAAVIAADQYKADVDHIEQKLSRERCTVDTIDRILTAAKLTGRERDYIRMRYLDNKPARYASMIIGKDDKTCWRIKISALRKVGDALRADTRRER